MKLDSFKEALDELGIGYRESGASLAVEFCPSCGRSSFKVLFRVMGVDENDRHFMGSCKRGECGQGYSSASYLHKAGMNQVTIRRYHGQDPNAHLSGLVPKPKIDPFLDTHLDSKVVIKPSTDTITAIDLDLSGFHPISSWKDHPAAQYAVGRGYCEEFKDIIQIDNRCNAVVFLVNEGQKTVGYQRRFLRPPTPHMKTQTSSGFARSKQVLKFPKEGADIVICEGPFTALSAWHYGYYGICTFGGSVSKDQMAIVLQLVTETGVKIGLSCENDAAGKKAIGQFLCHLYWANRKRREDGLEDIKYFKLIPEVGSDLNDAWQAGKGCVRVDDDDDDWAGPGLPPLNQLVEI